MNANNDKGRVQSMSDKRLTNKGEQAWNTLRINGEHTRWRNNKNRPDRWHCDDSGTDCERGAENIYVELKITREQPLITDKFVGEMIGLIC